MTPRDLERIFRQSWMLSGTQKEVASEIVIENSIGQSTKSELAES